MRGSDGTGRRYVPIRTCAGCGKKMEKGRLIRIVRTKDGSVAVDSESVHNGRGAYICRNRSCLDRAYKRKSLQRTLRAAVPAEVFEELQKETERFDAE